MANSDKNIVITPYSGNATLDPKIVFSGANSTTSAQNITVTVTPLANGTLSVDGSAGQLFSVTNSLSGTIFSVNDISGIPSIEVIDTGLVKIAQYSGNVVLGSATDDGVNKLQVNGSLVGTVLKSNVTTGTAPISVSSTTLVANLNADSLGDYQLDRITASLRSNRNITGGGTITVSATGYVLWSTRFVVISNGHGSHFATSGYFDINCPVTGTITGVGGAANVTATAAGIPLTSWQALYYILPVGSTSGSLAANFRVVGYNSAVSIPPEWVLICVVNGDSTASVTFNNGIVLKWNESVNTKTYTVYSAAIAGTAGTVTTAAQPNITSVGTLTSLAVTGNANVGNIGTAGLIVATGNINGANITGTHYGAATGLTSIPAGNLTGTVPNAAITGAYSGITTLTATTFVGSGANLTTINASNLSSGTIPSSVVPSFLYCSTSTVGSYWGDGLYWSGNWVHTVTGSYGHVLRNSGSSGADLLVASDSGTAGANATTVNYNFDTAGKFTAITLSSSVANGTAPLTVTSTTKVANLNVDSVDGAHTDTTYNTFGNGTIPIRHSSGYLYTNYLNTTANVVATVPTHVAMQTSSDDFIRWQTWADFRTNMFDSVTLTGATTLDSLSFTPATETLASVTGIEAASLYGSLSVAAQETEPRDLAFSSDGTKMYVLGNSGDDITQYTLGTAWRVSTGASPVTFSIAGQDAVMYGLFFKPDGTAFYTCGTTANSIYQYSLGTAWDITSASYVRTLSVTAYETDPQALVFSADGTKMYVMGTTGDDINQFNLSVAWDISSAVYNSVLLVNNTYTGEPAAGGLSINADGTKIWCIGTSYNRVIEVTMSTPWSISTGTITSLVPLFYAQDPAAEGTKYTLSGMSGVYVSEAQNRLYVCDYNNDRVFEYDITAGTKISGKSLTIAAQHVSVRYNFHVNGITWMGGGFFTPNSGYISGTLTCNTLNVTSSGTTQSIGTSLTTGIMNLFTGHTTGTLNIGGTAGTGAMTFGRSTATNTINIGTGAMASANTQTFNLGTAGLAGSSTIFNFGASAGNTTYTFLGTLATFAGLITAQNGIKLGTTVYPTYEINLDCGADAANSFRKIIDIIVFNGTYSTHGFIIDIIDPQANHATIASVDQIISARYYVACIRTESTVTDTPDYCIVKGPSSHVRAVRIATGQYEIQVQNLAIYRETRVRVSTYATNDAGHVITYFNGSVTGSTGTAQYNASPGNNIDWFQLVKATKYESTVTTGTAPLTVASTTVVTNLNADMLDGYHVGTTGANIPLCSSAITWTNNQVITMSSAGSALSVTNSGAGPGITTDDLVVTTTITAGNIYANSGTIGASLLTGTVTTNSQPNITSVGTLTSLAVTGNANVGNLGTTGLVVATGNITGGNLVTGGAVVATGNITGGNLMGIFANTTSNVRIPAAAGNVNISASGNANILVVTGAGANITGTLNATGNANIGNIGTVGLIIATGNITGANIIGTHYGAATGLTSIPGANVTGTVPTATTAGTVTTAAQPNITSTGTLTSLIIADGLLTRAMLKDCGMAVTDKGNSGTSTQTYDYTAGSVQTSTATGNHTIATSNWPPTGNHGTLLIQLTNGGAYTITWPTISWIKPDGTTTTSISTYLAALSGRAALQTSGMDQIMLWSRDAGTTIYGKII